jgi:hypothetical protein
MLRWRSRPYFAAAASNFGRELRHDLEVGRDVDELVAHRGEDDPADEGPRQRRIEDVGVFGEADPEMLPEGRRGGRHQSRQRDRTEAAH